MQKDKEYVDTYYKKLLHYKLIINVHFHISNQRSASGLSDRHAAYLCSECYGFKTHMGQYYL